MMAAGFKVKLNNHLFTRTFCTALWATTGGMAVYFDQICCINL